MKERCRQGYKIGIWWTIDRAVHHTAMPSIIFFVSLTSCKNTLQEIGYINKIENPDSLQKVVQKWRDIADDITYNMLAEVRLSPKGKHRFPSVHRS